MIAPRSAERLSDDDLMAAIRACGLESSMRMATVRARWKDGIDINEPSHDVRSLADAIVSRLAAKPDEDGVREATIRQCAEAAGGNSETDSDDRWYSGNAAGRRDAKKAVLALSTTGELKR